MWAPVVGAPGLPAPGPGHSAGIALPASSIPGARPLTHYDSLRSPFGQSLRMAAVWRPGAASGSTVPLLLQMREEVPMRRCPAGEVARGPDDASVDIRRLARRSRNK